MSKMETITKIKSKKSSSLNQYFEQKYNQINDQAVSI